MNHIFGRHRDANRTIDRNVQLVDLALSGRMLKFPHPLLARRVDVQRIVRHPREPEVEPRAPNERGHEEDERHDDPCGFENLRRLLLLGQLVVRAAAIHDRQNENHGEDQHRHRAADDGQHDEKRVRLLRDGRRLLGEEREIGQHHLCCCRSLRNMMTMNPARLRTVARRRIVVIAEQEELIDRRADFVRRRFDQCQAKVARFVFESVNVARQATVSCSNHYYSGVGKLVLLRIVRVMKSHRVRERVDRRLMPGKKVPSARRIQTAVAFDVGVLFGRGLLGHVARIDTHGDDIEILADIELQFC